MSSASSGAIAVTASEFFFDSAISRISRSRSIASSITFFGAGPTPFQAAVAVISAASSARSDWTSAGGVAASTGGSCQSRAMRSLQGAEAEEAFRRFDESFVVDVTRWSLGIWPRAECLRVVVIGNNYELGADLTAALCATASDATDRLGHYLRLLERSDEQNELWWRDWYDPSNIDLSVGGLYENAVYAASGSWAVFATQSNYALLGASAELLAAIEPLLEQTFASHESELIRDAFILFGDKRPRYLKPLLALLHGDAEAEQRITAAGFGSESL